MTTSNQPEERCDDPARAQRRWTVRRRMAKGSFALIIVEIVAPLMMVPFGLVDAGTLTALAAYLGAPTVGLFSIIGLYIGYSTKDDLKMAEIASAVK